VEDGSPRIVNRTLSSSIVRYTWCGAVQGDCSKESLSRNVFDTESYDLLGVVLLRLSSLLL
jgi:hypothetical protein